MNLLPEWMLELGWDGAAKIVLILASFLLIGSVRNQNIGTVPNWLVLGVAIVMMLVALGWIIKDRAGG